MIGVAQQVDANDLVGGLREHELRSVPDLIIKRVARAAGARSSSYGETATACPGPRLSVIAHGRGPRKGVPSSASRGLPLDDV
jgi:hypothetical protein